MNYLLMNDQGMYELYLDEKFIDSADGTLLGAMNLTTGYGYKADFSAARTTSKKVPLKAIEQSADRLEKCKWDPHWFLILDNQFVDKVDSLILFDAIDLAKDYGYTWIASDRNSDGVVYLEPADQWT